MDGADLCCVSSAQRSYLRRVRAVSEDELCLVVIVLVPTVIDGLIEVEVCFWIS